MSDAILVTPDHMKYTMEAPETPLRFIIRSGEKVLQQRWSVKHFEGDRCTGVIGEWRDVPTEDEAT